MSASNPKAEYTRRRADRQADFERYRGLYGKIAIARLIFAVIFLLMGWFSLVERDFSGVWLSIPLGVFFFLAMVHSRVAEAQGSASRAIDFYDDGISRIEDRWIGRGQTEIIGVDEEHLYASDLDIFGRGSLFELLSTARTRTGQEALASWLLSPANRLEILARQEAIEELRPMLELREHLATLGSDVVTSIHPKSIVDWGEAPLRLNGRWPRIVALLLALISIAAITNVVVDDTREAWLLLLVCFATEGAFVYTFRSRVRRVLNGADQHCREFKFISQLINRLESQSFKSGKLRDLQKSIEIEGLSVSRQLDRFVYLMDLADMRRNQIFALFFFLLSMTQVAFAIETWRRVCGSAISEWLSAIGEFEALFALSGYAYEHPADPFPEIVEPGPVFVGRELQHPFMPAAEGIPNSLSLVNQTQMMVVSGSNMSGKSTLLRTVGINTVLAMAGAPVRAQSLKVSPLAIGATLRITDSLQNGTSRFYSEIQRIRRIVDLTSGRLPVLFLLDEILHGTKLPRQGDWCGRNPTRSGSAWCHRFGDDPRSSVDARFRRDRREGN